MALRGILLSTGILFMSCSSWGAIIRVPEDAPSVLVAVDQAEAGDSVVVGPGVWTHRATRIINIDGDPRAITACAFPRGGISILAEASADVTTLDIGESVEFFPTVVMIANQLGAGDILLEGFTLTGATESIAAHALTAIYADKVALQSCRLIGNGSSPTEGIVAVVRRVDLEMVECQVSNNTGSHIISAVDSPAQFERCRFNNNIGHCIQAHQELTGAPVSVQNCEFISNRWRGRGTCVDVLYSPNMIVRDNLFLSNVATEFEGAAMRASECNGLVEFNVFAYDSCLTLGSPGAGIAWDNSTGQIRSNTFVGCHAKSSGSAFLAFGGGGASVFENNVVAHSTGSAAVREIGDYVKSTSCNAYWANEEGDGVNWEFAPTDIFADPIFCGFDSLDFTVREDSPCVVGGCGQIGALGIGCEDVSMDEMSWGKIKGLYRFGGKGQ